MGKLLFDFAHKRGVRDAGILKGVVLEAEPTDSVDRLDLGGAGTRWTQDAPFRLSTRKKSQFFS